MFIEGTLLTILGLCVLILPKLTSLSFGIMLSGALITYGAYKIITAIINRGYIANIVFKIGLGIFAVTSGVLLLFVPKISLLWLIALIGVYFLLESICSAVFTTQIRNILNLYGINIFSSIILFLIGLIIVIGVPVISFWLVAMLSGLGFLIKGMAKNSLYLSNKNNHNL